MEAFASVEDLAASWRVLTPAEQKRASVLLSQVSAAVQIRARLELAGHEDVYRLVTCLAVKRMMEAGADMPAVSNVSQTAGPYTGSLTFANPAGDFYLTSAEKKLLKIGGANVACVWPGDFGQVGGGIGDGA
jgi:hypothetical protein